MSSGQTPQIPALTSQELPATGERFVTQSMADHIQVAYEHLHRYLLAQECCRGKDILDIASGEGYGSNIIAQSAKSVVGVDISNDAVQFAQQKYKRANLRFLKGDCTKIPLGKACVDVVVSFETIEHILEQEAFIQEIRRVLRPGGLLIISSPDKHEYSDRSGYSNPFHLAELYRADFLRLLKRYFKNCRSLQQRLIAGSFIAADPDSKTDVCYGTHRGNLQGGTFNEGVHEGLYTIAVCSDQALPEILAGVFENKAESARIWHAFEELDNIRADMETLRGYLEDERRRIRECEAEKLRAQTHYQELSLRYENLEGTLRSQHAESTQHILTLQARAVELDQEAIARGEWGKRLDGEIEALRKIVTEQRACIESLEQELLARTNTVRACEKLFTELKAEIAADQTTISELEGAKAELLNQVDVDKSEQGSLERSKLFLSNEISRVSEERDQLNTAVRETQENNQLLSSKLGELEAEKGSLIAVQQSVLQERDSLTNKLEYISSENDRLQASHSTLQARIQTLQSEKHSLAADLDRLDSERVALLDGQILERAREAELSKELSKLRRETEDLRAAQDDLKRQVKELELSRALLEQARQESTASAEERQALIERFMKQLSSSLELSRTEISCMQDAQVVHISKTDISETIHCPMQTELCSLQTKSEELLTQIESDQKAAREQLREAQTTINALSREKHTIQEQLKRTSADWVEAEQQIIDAQSQLWNVLNEAELKLHWAASLDRDLCSMRKAVAERDISLEQKAAEYAQLEEELKQCQITLSTQAEKLAEKEKALEAQLVQFTMIKAEAAQQLAAAENLRVQELAALRLEQQDRFRLLEEQLATKTRESAESSKQLDQIKSSFAWKASALLRIFNGKLSDKKTK